MRKTLLAFLLLPLCALAQSNVLTGTVANYGLTPKPGVPVKLTLVSPKPRVVDGVMIQNDPVPIQSGTNGTFAFTNILWGKYTLAVGSMPTTWTVNVGTNTTGTVPIGSLADSATPVPPNPATNYYTQSQVDALIADVEAGTGTSAEPLDAGSVPVADRLAFAVGNGNFVRATVHPNALWLPTNWNGAQIWLAFTGTTNQSATAFGTATEDPFVYASSDGGNTWTLKSSAPLLSKEASCTLAGWSTNGWQADPEIFLDTNGVMRVIWMGFHTGAGGVTNAMFETSSTDGTTWSTPTLLKKWKSGVGNPWSTNATCAGPQIVTLPGGGLRLYYTDDSNYGTNAAGAATNTICYVAGLDSSGTNWDWGTVNRCVLTPYLTNSVTPWHFDIALVSSNRWFLGYGSQASSFIEYATSADGITWAPPGMGFLLPIRQKSEEYGYYKLTWAPVAGPNGIAWNVIANHTGTNQLLVNGWNFSLVRGLEPEPQALTYTGANTNWMLVGGTKTYNGINRIGALTVVDDFKGTSSGKVGIGQPFNGWGGIAIGYNAPMDATNYTLASDGTSPRLNAKTGGTVNFAVNNSVLASVSATALSSTVPFAGNASGMTNMNISGTQQTNVTFWTPGFAVHDYDEGISNILSASFAHGVQSSVGFSGTFQGAGEGLTNLNANYLTSGTVNIARLPPTPYLVGAAMPIIGLAGGSVYNLSLFDNYDYSSIEANRKTVVDKCYLVGFQFNLSAAFDGGTNCTVAFRTNGATALAVTLIAPMTQTNITAGADISIPAGTLVNWQVSFGGTGTLPTRRLMITARMK